ncbi:H-NS histone family protein [Caballeronia cordobensis]|uniref:H-NS histone family protein n=1 Tax=Caballeronia cordobensis TaxID=1353886 RepID=UPI00045F0540|nr:histone family protein nucleoid-structuring protein H-NS [Burkholderia sp. RPE67]
MATLKQIQARLKKLQAQAERLIAQRAQAVLDDIRALMERHGLTTDDIARHGKKTKPAKKPRVAHPAPAGRHETMTKLAKKGKLPAKYRNPETGETWSGWARPPAWIANVKDRSKFLIDAQAVESTEKPKAAAKKASRKRASAAKKSATAPAAKKTGAAKTAKPAAKPAAKRAAPRKRAAQAATPEEANATAPQQPAPDTPAMPTPPANDGPSA